MEIRTYKVKGLRELEIKATSWKEADRIYRETTGELLVETTLDKLDRIEQQGKEGE